MYTWNDHFNRRGYRRCIGNQPIGATISIAVVRSLFSTRANKFATPWFINRKITASLFLYYI